LARRPSRRAPTTFSRAGRELGQHVGRARGRSRRRHHEAWNQRFSPGLSPPLGDDALGRVPPSFGRHNGLVRFLGRSLRCRRAAPTTSFACTVTRTSGIADRERQKQMERPGEEGPGKSCSGHARRTHQASPRARRGGASVSTPSGNGRRSQSSEKRREEEERKKQRAWLNPLWASDVPTCRPGGHDDSRRHFGSRGGSRAHLLEAGRLLSTLCHRAPGREAAPSK